MPQQTVAVTQDIDPGILLLSQQTVGDFPKHLQTEETSHVLQWLRTLVSAEHSVVWISYHQLLLDYQRFSHRLGPFTNGKKWVQRGADVEYEYPKQVQWFGRFLQNMAKAIQVPLQTDQRRPSSTTIAFWCGCLSVSFDERNLTAIDEIYKQKAKHLPIRQVNRDLADIPPGYAI